jgi:cilia- and flagella-associated protein 52
MGFTADIIVWDLATRQMHKKLCLHKVMIQSLSFSHDETKLASLGGPDDGSLVLWDVASGEAICGSPADNRFVECVKFLNNNNNRLMTAGQGTHDRSALITCIAGI